MFLQPGRKARSLGRLVKTSILSLAAAAAVFLAAGAAQASGGVLTSANLASNIGHYTNIDGAGLDLDVTKSLSGSLSVIGGGVYQGLWFGGNNADGVYTLTFNKPIDYVSFTVNAMSTSSNYFETIGAFTTNAAIAPTLAFTNISSTAWDGSTITSSSPDGYFKMALTAVSGSQFSTFSFFHDQDGVPNGSVFKEISFQRVGGDVVVGDGGTGGGVPEPATWALMLTGFGMAGVALRRGASLSRAA